MDTPADFLKSVYHARKSKNHRYSLRAFAVSLGISSGRLSDILNGRQRISNKAAAALASKLGVDRDQQELFIQVSRAYNERTEYVGEDTISLDLEQFRLISDPVYFYILSLLKTTVAEMGVERIAERLGYSSEVIGTALENLEKLGFLARNGGRLIPKSASIITPTDIPSEIIRESHKKRITKAIESLTESSVSERDITSMTMAIDVKKIPEAKKMIRQFRRKLSKFLEEGEASEVYDLNIQLIKISR
ncbi:MAG: hypothetical protein OM95_14895 [Bdellovibrio sp. ArHS]|uniref:TIGR02147 family protein n=1 Tax=Bdellovibrio sp. ArHS TaxID=1569284 RepID=UPI000582C3A0|nr:TIGR02147 family protein [Bdellovibrio sp. ArHS]KHD87382.1 MAG: hypothetical protein OM95_14895 [Bdellovibrio sp. ArHS]